LDLPAELQLRIFEFVVTSDKPIEITPERPVTNRHRLPPALTRTCRIIRHDAIKLYYARNNFRANYCAPIKGGKSRSDQEILIRWLRSIGAEKRSLNRSLEIFDYLEDDNDDYCLGKILGQHRRSTRW